MTKLNAADNRQQQDGKGLDRPMKIWLLAAFTLPLMACGGLDQQKIAQEIQQDIVSNGGTGLKTVSCPQGVQAKAGQAFECIGEMDNGYTFAIAVQQQDDQGKVIWDVPHAKGLVNVSKLEAQMQETLTTEIEQPLSVSCGGMYKAVNPGEGFECQLSYEATQPNSKTTKPGGKPNASITTQVEKINVTTDPDGHVLWQRVLPNVAAQLSKP